MPNHHNRVLRFAVAAALLLSVILCGARLRAADISWNNFAGGAFNVAANWTPAVVPGPGDNALITQPGNYTVTLTADVTLGSLKFGTNLGSQSLVMASGRTLALIGASKINDGGTVELSTGSIALTGNLDVEGRINWSGGLIAGSATVRILAAGQLDMFGTATKTFSGGISFENDGVMFLSDSGNLNGTDGGIINRASFELNDTAALNPVGNAPVLNNVSPGSITRASGTGSSVIGFVFNNNGSVDVQAGTLELSGGGNSSGSFTVSSGLGLGFTGGTHTINPGGSINSSGGKLSFTTGAVVIGGGYSVTGLTEILGATVTLNTAAATTQTLDLTAGTLDGTGTLSVSGGATWSGATLGGSGTLRIQPPATLTIVGAGVKVLTDGRILQNQGTTAVTGPGSIQGLNGASIVNSGTFDIQTDMVLDWVGGATPTFQNSGTLKKSAGAGVATVEFGLNNSGTVQADSGILALSTGGGTSSGQVTIAATGTLDVLGSTYVFSPLSTTTVSGTLSVSGGVLTIDGALAAGSGAVTVSAGTLSVNPPASSIHDLTISGGTFSGGGGVTVISAGTWSGGTISGSGTLTVDNTASLQIIGAGAKVLDGGRTIQNNGNILISGSGSIQGSNGGGFSNNGAIDIQADVFFDHVAGVAPTMNNLGLLLRTGSSGVAELEFAFANTGTVDIQTGTLVLSGSGGISSNGAHVQSAPGTVLNVIAGSYTFDASTTTALDGQLQVSGGTLTVDGAFLLTNPLTIAGGTLVVNTPTVDVPTLTLTSGTLAGSGTVRVTSAATWNGGVLSGTGTVRLLNGAVMSMSGTGTKSITNGRVLDNQGQIITTGTGSLQGSNGASILNSGLFEMQNSLFMDDVGGALSSFNNSGTLRKAVLGAPATIEFALNSAGNIDVQTGTLVLVSGGGTIAGPTTVSATSTLQVTSGNYNFSAPSSTTVAGEFRVTGGNVIVDGNLTSTGTLTVDGGGLFLNMASAATPNLSLSAGTIGGTAPLDVSVVANWSGGGFSDTGILRILNGAQLLITGPGVKSISSGRVIQNQGTATVTGTGSIQGSVAGGFSNSGVFDVQTDMTFDHVGGAIPTFSNSGTFTRSAGTGAMVQEFTLNNTGTFVIATGVVGFQNGGGISSGTITIQPAGRLEITGNNYTFSAPSTTTINGELRANGGFVFLDGAVNQSGTMSVQAGGIQIDAASISIPTLSISGGTLAGSGTVTVTGGATWSGGTVGGAGTLVVGPAGQLLVGGAAAKLLTGSRTINNQGTLRFNGTGSLQAFGGVAINNSGVMELQTDTFLDHTGGAIPSLNNGGTLSKTGGAGVSTIEFNFTNNGTVQVEAGTLGFSASYTQPSGLTKLAGAILAGPAAIDIQGGSIEGVGHVFGNVVLGGRLSPVVMGASSIRITGNLLCLPTSEIDVELAGPTPVIDYDQVIVDGTATLDGTLTVSFLPPFQPAVSDTFNVILHGSHVGSFSSVVTPPVGGEHLAASYSIPAVQLINQALPTITAIPNQTINENTVLGPILFTVDDPDSGAASLTLSATSTDTLLIPNGSIVFGGSGAGRTVTLTPAASASGSSSISISVTDPDGNSTSTSFLVTVLPVNDAPTITPIADTVVTEDSPTAPIPFDVDDIETPPANLIVTATSANTTLVPNINIVTSGPGRNRTVVVTPAANQSGTTIITLQVTDAGGATANTSFLLTVTAVNDSPSITPINDLVIQEDQASPAIGFVINDPETPVGSLTVTASSSNAILLPNANLVLGGAGANRTLSFSPAPNQSGSATLLVSVTDGNGASANRSFNLTVQPVNDAPTLQPIADQVMTEGTNPPPIPVVVADADDAPALLTLTAVSSNPGVLPNGSFTFAGFPSNTVLVVSPPAAVTGVFTVTVNATDPAGAVASRTFQLTINSLNQPPQILNLGSLTLDEDTPATLNFSVSDPESQPGTLTVAVSSSNPTLIPDSAIAVTGSGGSRTLTFTPALNQSGSAILSITVTDPNQRSTTATSTVVVAPVNDPPALPVLEAHQIDEDTVFGPVAITVLDPDTPPDQVMLQANSSAPGLVSADSITLVRNGSVWNMTIHPQPNQSGRTTITLVANDSFGGTSSRSFELTVVPVNDPPFISGIDNQRMQEDSERGPVGFVVSDIETAADQLTVAAGSSNAALFPPGSIQIEGTGSQRALRLRPAPNQTGPARIQVSVTDGEGVLRSMEFSVDVLPSNDAPTFPDLPDAVVERIIPGDRPTQIPFIVADDGTPTADLRVEVLLCQPGTEQPFRAEVTGQGSARTLLLTPSANLPPGQTSPFLCFRLRLTDADGAEAFREFSVAVRSGNVPPALSSIGSLRISDTARGTPVGFTVSDDRTPVEAISVTVDSSAPAVLPPQRLFLSGSGASRTFSVNPIPGVTGSTVITLTANDGELSSSVSFVLEIVPGLPSIVTQPAPQTVARGDAAELTVGVVGTGPFTYQWRRGQQTLPNQTGPALSIPSAQAADAGIYTVVVSNAQGPTTSEGAVLDVLVPPAIAQQPQSQTVAPGSRVVLTIVPDLQEAFQLQWRKNGLNIPGANQASLVFERADESVAGSYSCVIETELGAITSDDAVVSLLLEPLLLSDAFAGAPLVEVARGLVRASNLGATREAGEPRHAEKPVGASVWLRYRAPATGVLEFSTVGSSFDTVLAVYTGATLPTLTALAQDDDSGGFAASRLSLNVQAGTTYSVAIDGVGRTTGGIVLRWELQPTTLGQPEIVDQPQTISVLQGRPASFSVSATTANGSLTYQWLLNDSPIRGATGPTYQIDAVNADHVGLYSVIVNNGFLPVRSANAALQLITITTTTGPDTASSEDKFADVSSQSLAPQGLGAAGLVARLNRRPLGGLASGYSGTQVFSTYGSASEAGEPNHCGIIGGASQWFAYRAETTGVLTISTEGSDFDTVLAVYTGTGEDLASLQLVSCDDNGGANPLTSQVRIAAVAGTTYFIAVDGVNGDTGTARLSYFLETPIRIEPAQVVNGVLQVRLTGARPGESYTLQTSADLKSWTVIETKADPAGVVLFNSPVGDTSVRRFYRVVAAR